MFLDVETVEEQNEGTTSATTSTRTRQVIRIPNLDVNDSTSSLPVRSKGNRGTSDKGWPFSNAAMRKNAPTNRMTLLLGKYTQLTPVENQGFPLHHFNFAAYNEIGHRADSRDSILTDYIGVVRNIGQLREFGDFTTNCVTRRNIQIQNLSGNSLTFTLWNEMATGFQISTFAGLEEPLIIAVSSCCAKRFAGGLQLSSSMRRKGGTSIGVPIFKYSLKKNAINSNRLQPFEQNDLFLYAVTDSGMNKRLGHSVSGDLKVLLDTIFQLESISVIVYDDVTLKKKIVFLARICKITGNINNFGPLLFGLT